MHVLTSHVAPVPACGPQWLEVLAHVHLQWCPIAAMPMPHVHVHDACVTRMPMPHVQDVHDAFVTRMPMQRVAGG